MSIYHTLSQKGIATRWFLQRRFINNGVKDPVIDELNKYEKYNLILLRNEKPKYKPIVT
jgi:hypothetical protein